MQKIRFLGRKVTAVGRGQTNKKHQQKWKKGHNSVNNQKFKYEFCVLF